MRKHRFAAVSVPLVSLAAIGSWLGVVSAQKPPTTPDYSQEATIVEQVRTLLRFENDGTGRRETYMRVRAQSEAGVQAYGQLIIGYNAANERPEIAFVRVRKADGSVVATPPDAVQDLSAPLQRVAPIYTDFRQKHVTVQSLRPGDVLEFSVITTIHTPLAPGQFWSEHNFEQDAVVLEEHLVIDVPSSRAVTLKVRPGFESAPTDRDGRRVYRWARAQLRSADEKKAEIDKSQDTTKTTGSNEEEVSEVRLTTFQNWEQVGRWYAALETPQRAPTPEIRKKAAELTAGRATELEKLVSLYDFVATNFRYVSLSLGAGRYQPRQAGAVLQDQYGDCKDKHTLLASLIEAVGLKATAVLISTVTSLDSDFPSPSQFNHVITLVAAGGQDVWLDTTTEVAPFRLLAHALRNKRGLVIDAEAPRLQQTPPNPPMNSLVAQSIEATLGSDGKLDARVQMTMRGDVELLMRSIFRRTPAAQWRDVVGAVVTGEGTPGDVANLKISDPASLRDPFSIEFDLSLTQYAAWTSNKISLVMPLATGAEWKAAAASENTTAPMQLGAAPTEYTYRLRLTLPADVTPRVPVSVTLTRDYAAYRSAYAIAGRTVTAERVTNVQLSEIPADRRQDYLAFEKVMTTDAAQRLTLETASALSSEAPAGLTAAQLHRSEYDALQAGNFAQAVTLLNRVVELEPKDKLAWNNLGRAYMGMRQTDKAIAAFTTQIAVNPYDQFAFNNLGRAHAAKQEFEKAEAAFLKQLEVNPLDKYVPSNLGALYLEQRKYGPAAEQFEKAIALFPDNAFLHIQAGKAHLNLARIDRATAAFDRAVTLAPTPVTWNNIAYELSVHGVLLDRAQQYAESAVSTASAASRNLDVSRGDASSLAIVRSLGSYWDTLGWVAFARGDVARANTYVEMAWKLSQEAEVGDHLAQIYDKLGRRQDAISMYASALASRRPSSDVRRRLEAVLPGGTNIDTLTDTFRPRLSEMRTTRIDGKGTVKGTADFLVLFSAPGKVEGVRFLSGDEALRPLTESIRAASFDRMFPDEVPAKILRRALVGCAASGCALTLILPDDAEPVK